MRQVAAESNNDETEAKATGWCQAYNRTMTRMMTVAQRWAKAMADMKVAIGTATSSLMSWRNDVDMANEMDGSDRASTGQCHPRVAGGSNPPAVMYKVSDPVKVDTETRAEDHVRCALV